MKELIKYLCATGSSFNGIKHPAFVRFCQSLDSDFKMADKRTIIKRLIELSDLILAKQLQKEALRYVTLLVDGGSCANKRYIAACMFDGNKSEFLRLIQSQIQTASTLVKVLKPLTIQLQTKGIVVTAICSDGCSTNNKAFNENSEESLSKQSGLPIIQLYCQCHLLNLVIKDFLRKDDSDSVYCIIIRTRDSLHFRSSSSPFFDMPREVETRWLSFAPLFQYYRQHKETIAIALEGKNEMDDAKAIKEIN